ncbi:hypothetical protein Tco_0449599 [Tanacetum coccineum]
MAQITTPIEVIVLTIGTKPTRRLESLGYVEATKKKVKKPNVHVAELVYGAMLHADVGYWAQSKDMGKQPVADADADVTNESGSDTGLHPRHLRDKGNPFHLKRDHAR